MNEPLDDRLDEILAWLRILAISPLRDLLKNHLKTSTDWVVYDETDGKKNRDQVGRRAGISGRAVGNKWKIWRELGLLVDRPTSPYPIHVVSPGVVGMEKPE
jgi:hypothetical protein